MKNLILAFVVTLSLTFGFNSLKAADFNNNPVETSTNQTSGYKYERVYEDGAIWVYVYTEDGIFVSKHIESQQ